MCLFMSFVASGLYPADLMRLRTQVLSVCCRGTRDWVLGNILSENGNSDFFFPHSLIMPMNTKEGVILC